MVEWDRRGTRSALLARGQWVLVAVFKSPPRDALPLGVAMSIELPLNSMSVAEKLQLMETSWSSLCQNPGDVRSPEWHKEIASTAYSSTRERRSKRVMVGDEAKTRLLKLGQ